MAKSHTEQGVLASLRKKNDVRVIGSEIQILKDKVFNKKINMIDDNPLKKWDLGNGSWGKIDYLVQNFGYRMIYVSNFK